MPLQHLLSRPTRRKYTRLLLLTLLIFFGIALIQITRPVPPKRTSPFSTWWTGKHKPRVFIAAQLWNREPILLSHWNDALVSLVSVLGPENVFVAILESGSWDGTPEALAQLDERLGQLGVQRWIGSEGESHQEIVENTPSKLQDGWVPVGKKHRWKLLGHSLGYRRIPYLANLRNGVMAKLTELAQLPEGQGRIFDKVIWLNDVVFTPEDVLTVLNTRQGDYAAACTLDFSKPPSYYDTFALRGIQGHEHHPKVAILLSAESRMALMNNDPDPVRSCWNGIAVFDAAPFYKPGGIPFRGTDQSFAMERLEASECCLIHADNPLSASKGVWLNPNARVAYHASAYEAVNSRTRTWPPGYQKVWGVWKNRIVRWIGWHQRRSQERSIIRKVERRKMENPDKHWDEGGSMCLVNEVHVIMPGRWAHV